MQNGNVLANESTNIPRNVHITIFLYTDQFVHSEKQNENVQNLGEYVNN